MRKKLILRRNLRKGGGGGPPYLKYLVIGAVSLVFLVIVTPFLVKQKKEVNKRPVPEKGAITKELPKQPEQPAPERLPEPAERFEPPRSAETGPPETAVAPEPVKPPQVQAEAQQVEPVPATAQKPPVAKPPPLQGKTSAVEKAPSDESARPVEPPPKDLFPKQRTPAGAPLSPARKEPAKAGAEPGSSAPSRQTGEYVVQVGSVFSDKSQAQTDAKNMSAKGYKAVVRPVDHGCGYIVTTGMVPESMAYTLLEQMKMQGLNDTKVIKVAH